MDDRSVEEKEEERLLRNINKRKNNPRPSITTTTTTQQPPKQNNPPPTQNPPPQQPTKVPQPNKAPSKFVRPKKGAASEQKQKGSGLTIRMKNSAQMAHIKEHDTFTAWANWVLKGSDITISNLTKDLEDGTKLVILAQILLRKDIKYIKSPKLAFHKYENINIAVGALKEKAPNLTIAAQDIFEKEKLPQILGFFYQLISQFSYGWGRDEKKDKNENKGKSIAEIAYGWVEDIAKAYPGCKGLEPSKNGTKDFKNGELLKAIVHNALLGTGSEFKLQDYDNKSPEETVTAMIDLAQRKLGIPKFFFTEDITEEATPQERLIVPWLLAVKAEVYQTHLPTNERNNSFPVQAMVESPRRAPPKVNELSETEPTPKLPSEAPPSFTTTDLPLPEIVVESELDKENSGLNKGGEHDHDHDHDHNHEHDNLQEIEEEEKKEGLNTTDDINTSGNFFEKRLATEKEQKEKCKGCQVQFGRDTIVVVNGDLYHEKCFVCKTCQCTFTKFYWSWEGLPYCFDHYQDAAGLICKKCTKKISDEVVVVAVGSKWHPSCFSCKVCNTHLNEKFYFFEDNIYCDKDYFKVAGDVCGACYEPIRGQLIVEALKKKWHSICFVCTDCHIRFLPDDENAPNVPFYNNDGKPYCSDCDNKLHGLKDLPVCAKCNKSIEGSVLQAMKKTWHEHCFVCTKCGEEFTESFVNVSGLPYCTKCESQI